MILLTAHFVGSSISLFLTLVRSSRISINVDSPAESSTVAASNAAHTSIIAARTCPMKDERHICVGRICGGEDRFAVLTLHLPQLGSNSLVSSKSWLREGIKVKGGWLHADGCLVALKDTFLTSVGVNNWRC
jgi:hypothetical protein